MVGICTQHEILHGTWHYISRTKDYSLPYRLIGGGVLYALPTFSMSLQHAPFSKPYLAFTYSATLQQLITKEPICMASIRPNGPSGTRTQDRSVMSRQLQPSELKVHNATWTKDGKPCGT